MSTFYFVKYTYCGVGLLSDRIFRSLILIGKAIVNTLLLRLLRMILLIKDYESNQILKFQKNENN